MSEKVADDRGPAQVLLVTGPSGAGRSTAVRSLEDIGYEVIDNLPLSLLERVIGAPRQGSRLAVGIDVRNREFSVDGILDALIRISADPGIDAELLYLDCRAEVLIRRYSETRRRHPLAPAETPDVGVARELELLVPVRGHADLLIETSEMTPHDLRAEIERLFGAEGGARMAVSVESFSYRRGLPRGLDMVFDVRFLANPHWEPGLRDEDGRDPAVADFVAADRRYNDFFTRMRDLVLSLLPAFVEEGKTYLSIGLGCTGGQHRSVAVCEQLANALAEQGWQVSTRHRELERRGDKVPPLDAGTHE